MIDEAHGAATEEDTIAGLVAATSSRVIVFKTWGSLVDGMEKGYLLSSRVISFLESLYNFLRRPSSLFMSIRKSASWMIVG